MGMTRSSRSDPAADAWQPLTFGGVAAFADAPFARLVLVASVVALLVTSSVLRLALTVWEPTAAIAITRLPPEGAIDNGRLVWPHGRALVLADNAFVSVTVTPEGAPPAAQSADVQFEFRPTSLEVSSLLGSVELPYPPGYLIALNRTELEALWGAWRPHLLLGVVLAAFLGQWVLWCSLATLLALPVRLYARILDRRATLVGCWKLAVAALLAGAIVMSVAVLGYSLRRVSLGELLLVNGLHLLVNAAFLLISPLRLPSLADASPFAQDDPEPHPADNPFAGSDGTGAEPPAGDGAVPADSPELPEETKPADPDPIPPPAAPRRPPEPDEPFNPS